MNLIILKENIKEGLMSLERVVTENSTLPILKNILIKTESGKVKLSATNLEIGITATLFGKILEEGIITVPFKALYDLVINSDSDRITLETEDNNILKIKGENYEAKLQTLNSDEFPIIPKIEQKSHTFEIETSILKTALSEVVIAAQISEIRPEISGVLFDFQISLLKFVATDSFRLAEKTLDHTHFKTNIEQGIKIIIPLKTVQEIIRIFPESKPITIYLEPQQIMIKNDSLELISRLIDGNYPEYEQIIPKTAETELILKKENLVNALKLVSTFSGKNNDIHLQVKEGSKTLELYSRNQNLGENNYLIPVKIKGTEVKEVVFNWRYLLDGLKPIKNENIILTINGTNKPAILKSPDATNYFYILMPIKNE